MENGVWLYYWICFVGGKVQFHTAHIGTQYLIRIVPYRLLTAFMAYMTTDWRVLLQVFSGIHVLTPLILHFICESPRWLISTGRKLKIGEAKTILQEIAKRNGTNDITIDINDFSTAATEHRENFLIIFKTPVLLKHTLIIYRAYRL